MLDGTALFMGPWLEAQHAGTWNDERGTNHLDTGAPYYDTYRCADGEYVAVGALEPQFYARLLDGLGIDPASTCPIGTIGRNWERIAAGVRRPLQPPAPATSGPAASTGVDACVTPVLRLAEVAEHPQITAGAKQSSPSTASPHPAPAPRLDRTPGASPAAVSEPGADTDEVLRAAGYDAAQIAALRSEGVVA